MGTMQFFWKLIKALVGIAIARSMQHDGEKKPLQHAAMMGTKAIAACSNLLTLGRVLHVKILRWNLPNLKY